MLYFRISHFLHLFSETEPHTLFLDHTSNNEMLTEAEYGDNTVRVEWVELTGEDNSGSVTEVTVPALNLDNQESDHQITSDDEERTETTQQLGPHAITHIFLDEQGQTTERVLGDTITCKIGCVGTHT